MKDMDYESKGSGSGGAGSIKGKPVAEAGAKCISKHPLKGLAGKASKGGRV